MSDRSGLRSLIPRGSASTRYKLTLLLALLLQQACSPSVGQHASPSAPHTHSSVGFSTSSPPPPAPPPPLPAPPNTSEHAVVPVQIRKLTQGPQICIAERVDLREVFFSVDIDTYSRPESSLMLREWIKEAWLRELENITVRWSPSACNDSLLCLAVAPKWVAQTAEGLARTLSDLKPGSFYAVRAETLSLARDHDATSSRWILETKSAAVHQPSAALALALKQPLSSDAKKLPSWLRLLNQEAGSAFLIKQSPVQILTSAPERFGGARITIAGPTLDSRLFESLSQIWDKLPHNKAKKRRRTETTRAPDNERPRTIMISREASERTYALVSWRPPPPEDQDFLKIAHQFLISRWREKHIAGISVTRAHETGLYRSSGLAIEGEYEDVVATVRALNEEHDRLVSAAGLPSQAELDEALIELNKQARQTLEPRCKHRPAPSIRPKSISDFLRRTGPPTSIIWGTSESLLESSSTP